MTGAPHCRFAWAPAAAPRPAPLGRAALLLALDPHDHDLIAARPHRQPHTIPRRQPRRVELLGRASHSHHLHRAHAQRGDGLVANQQQIGRGTCHDLAANLVGRRTDDGAPKAGGKESEEDDEQQNEEPARAGAPAYVSVSVPGQ